ncbi:MAG: alanine racemase [Lachnospiraceae bacterium]|nr:alanine racemase [Lachnospiraceae bacterium]
MKTTESVPGTERVCATIDLNAIRHNLEAIHAHCGEDVKILHVIKADGYGHGAVPIAGIGEKLPFVYGHAVVTFEEGKALRANGIRKPILILGAVFPYCFEELFDLEIMPTVFQKEMALALSAIGQNRGKALPVHLAVDTGMGRIGVMPDEEGIRDVKEMASLPGIVIDGIFTHYSKADEEDLSYTDMQLSLFTGFLSRLEEEGIRIPHPHTSNSAAIIGKKEAHFNLVRAGIISYGLWPSAYMENKGIDLKPALSFTSHVIHVKTLPPGKRISYGGTFVTTKETIVATIPVGYADGYPRGLSGKGYCLIRGKRAPILGRVCMDQMMVDVTDIPGVEYGDLVTLIGKDGEEAITMERLGDMADRFNYELATLISDRVPRLYIQEER